MYRSSNCLTLTPQPLVYQPSHRSTIAPINRCIKQRLYQSTIASTIASVKHRLQQPYHQLTIASINHCINQPLHQSTIASTIASINHCINQPLHQPLHQPLQLRSYPIFLGIGCAVQITCFGLQARSIVYRACSIPATLLEVGCGVLGQAQ